MSKKVFITGGSRGIGRGIALRLAKAGYDVAFTYHLEQNEAETLKTEILNLGQNCFYYQASLQDASIPEQITKKAIEDLGGIDVLVCNAGKTKFTSIRTIDLETIDFVYGLNYRSYVMSTKIAANYMIENQIPGRIIHISSTRGIRAYRDDAIYGSLKAALNRLIQSLAIELAEYNITINSIAPGATSTRGNYSLEELQSGHISSLIPLKRKGKPDDVAGLVEFLISDDASYITGETIKVDGGLILYGPNERPNGGQF
ncbi:SDR family NAD(P)-dependent oxidoreductase [Peloplasma aerotolerans]|uniref:SDR family oxidoreductase n=1 Tax=Peloplasma aerotolerans TaxID=3044389 RepID=A0AAW6U7R8_9MOLU|nr:SDR family oxidoreductase [Mariniplasma sp. M4Ah]MDI6452825.1 SDR family oxidoreductase [Mariniplasma sp. M4Ah]